MSGLRALVGGTTGPGAGGAPGAGAGDIPHPLAHLAALSSAPAAVALGGSGPLAAGPPLGPINTSTFGGAGPSHQGSLLPAAGPSSSSPAPSAASMGANPFFSISTPMRMCTSCWEAPAARLPGKSGALGPAIDPADPQHAKAKRAWCEDCAAGRSQLDVAMVVCNGCGSSLPQAAWSGHKKQCAKEIVGWRYSCSRAKLGGSAKTQWATVLVNLPCTTCTPVPPCHAAAAHKCSKCDRLRLDTEFAPSVGRSCLACLKREWVSRMTPKVPGVRDGVVTPRTPYAWEAVVAAAAMVQPRCGH